MILVGMIVYFIYGVVLRCPLSHANGGPPAVGCCNMDKWVIAYGSKEDLILSAMVGFYDLNDL